MDDKTRAWIDANRKTHRFQGANDIVIVIAAPNQEILDYMVRDARDVYGDGSRWSLEGGDVIVDCGMRRVLEEPRAHLGYVILENDNRVFLAEGAGANRRTEGGQTMSQGVPKIYGF